MKRVTYFVLVILVFAFSSCEQFFTTGDKIFGTSLGKPQQYNLSGMNAGNVDDWLDSARMNPRLAEELLKKIQEELENPNLSSFDKAKLMNAGLQLALQTAGLGTAFINQISTLLGSINPDNENPEENIMNEVQKIFSGGAKTAADNISAMAQHNLVQSGSSIPQFSEDYKSMANPTDVALAVVILTMDMLDDVDWSDPENLIEELGVTVTDNGVTFVGTDPARDALVAYINLIVGSNRPEFDNNPVTSMIREAFSFNSLI